MSSSSAYHRWLFALKKEKVGSTPRYHNRNTWAYKQLFRCDVIVRPSLSPTLPWTADRLVRTRYKHGHTTNSCSVETSPQSQPIYSYKRMFLWTLNKWMDTLKRRYIIKLMERTLGLPMFRTRDAYLKALKANVQTT